MTKEHITIEGTKYPIKWINLEKVSDIIKDIEKGLTDKEIAKRYGLAQSTVWVYVRRLRANGYEIPKRKRGRRLMPL